MSYYQKGRLMFYLKVFGGVPSWKFAKTFLKLRHSTEVPRKAFVKGVPCPKKLFYILELECTSLMRWVNAFHDAVWYSNAYKNILGGGTPLTKAFLGTSILCLSFKTIFANFQEGTPPKTFRYNIKRPFWQYDIKMQNDFFRNVYSHRDLLIWCHIARRDA